MKRSVDICGAARVLRVQLILTLAADTGRLGRLGDVVGDGSRRGTGHYHGADGGTCFVPGIRCRDRVDRVVRREGVEMAVELEGRGRGTTGQEERRKVLGSHCSGSFLLAWGSVTAGRGSWDRYVHNRLTRQEPRRHNREERRRGHGGDIAFDIIPLALTRD